MIRCMVLWFPDWPVQAVLRAAGPLAGLDADAPIALIEHGVVHACSAAARATGVRRGLRVREAQARCPELVVHPYDPALDARAFEPVLTALTDGVPTVQVIRPGVVVIRAQGAARFFGGEPEAAHAIHDLLGAAGAPAVRIGIADGPFTAEQAARASGRDGLRIVPAGGSAAFLAPLPVALLALPELVALLARLGVRTLGAFAALPETEVQDRFGPEGAAAHRVAAGLDPRRFVPRVPERDLTRSIAFEPPLEQIEAIAFSMRTTAEAFLAGLIAERLVCTGLTVEVGLEGGGVSTRTWLHPRSFTPLDVLDRVRWQLQGAGEAGDLAPVETVRLVPETLDAAAHHEQGLWGGGPDERIHSALSRVQSMLGHGAVVTATVGGGRLAADRQVLVPWGERARPARDPDRPWPGALPGFAPPSVFPVAPRVAVLDAAGAPLTVDDRDALSNPPRTLTAPGSAPARVRAWAGPWPIDERWWDPAAARHVHRMQVVTDDETAWLLLHEHGGWWAEARYD